jgi:phosphatidylserine decarboxylase
MITYLYNRHKQSIVEEDAYKIGGLVFLYQSKWGKLLTNIVLKRRFVSKAYGRYMRSTGSIKQIAHFVKHYQIDLSEVERPLDSFRCFNDFFIRKLKAGARPVDKTPGHLISPADSRLFVFRINSSEQFPVKGYWYQLNDLVKDEKLSAEYLDGWCFVYRLAPSDYHRYCYIDNGHQKPVVKINGVLHSVNPIALKSVAGVMARNYRELTILHTENFGAVVHIEVGALFVGKIVQKKQGAFGFLRGQEKGWFEFGGSTVIQLFKKGTVMPDPEILEHSAKGMETIVKMGEKVGLKDAVGVNPLEDE